MTLRTITVIFLVSLLSCKSSSNRKTNKEIMTIAREYVSGQLISPVEKSGDDGIVTISDGNKEYYIDPANIFTGLIDGDNREDALITIVSYEGNYLSLIEHLFLVRMDKKLTLQRSIESDMRILGLNDRIITAEVPTHPRSSPLFNCPECREVIKYRYQSGELIKTE